MNGNSFGRALRLENSSKPFPLSIPSSERRPIVSTPKPASSGFRRFPRFLLDGKHKSPEKRSRKRKCPQRNGTSTFLLRRGTPPPPSGTPDDAAVIEFVAGLRRMFDSSTVRSNPIKSVHAPSLPSAHPCRPRIRGNKYAFVYIKYRVLVEILFAC